MSTAIPPSALRRPLKVLVPVTPRVPPKVILVNLALPAVPLKTSLVFVASCIKVNSPVLSSIPKKPTLLPVPSCHLNSTPRSLLSSEELSPIVITGSSTVTVAVLTVVVVPLTVKSPFTCKLPPNVVKPVPTVNVLVPEILTLLLKVLVPVTLNEPPNVVEPVPLTSKVPFVIVLPLESTVNLSVSIAIPPLALVNPVIVLTPVTPRVPPIVVLPFVATVNLSLLLPSLTFNVAFSTVTLPSLVKVPAIVVLPLAATT